MWNRLVYVWSCCAYVRVGLWDMVPCTSDKAVTWEMPSESVPVLCWLCMYVCGCEYIGQVKKPLWNANKPKCA